MGVMDIVIYLLIVLISALLVLVPPIAVWRALARPASGQAAWLQPALALTGPFIAAFVFVVLVWLPSYSGQCGGWLGETEPCRGFGQDAIETMFWAAMSLAMPGLLGLVLGVAILAFGLIRRRMSHRSV